MAKEVTEASLRKGGYMTVDEFINIFTPGLKEYLDQNWSWAGKEALHHPEDLAMNTSIYVDVMCHVLSDFGANPERVKKNGSPT